MQKKEYIKNDSDVFHLDVSKSSNRWRADIRSYRIRVGRIGVKIMLYYLDIETTGLDSEKDKVITIQFAKIDFNTGMMIQPISLIAEWQSSEKNILEKAYSFLMEGNEWDFVPCGYNILHFDLPFLFSRFQSVLKKPVTYEFLDRPTLDLKSIFILMNGGRFNRQ